MPRSASPAAAQAVTSLMEGVSPAARPPGSASPSYLCAAVKTGTAQTGPQQGVNHDWMIGFAPANNPQIAVAVVVPYQNISSDGAGIAGPIVKKIMQAALPAGLGPAAVHRAGAAAVRLHPLELSRAPGRPGRPPREATAAGAWYAICVLRR